MTEENKITQSSYR